MDAEVLDVTGRVRVASTTIGDRVFKVIGECKRCGKCCEALNCEHLSYAEENGQKVAVCDVYWTRPWGCALYPRDPTDDLQEGCGYSWEEI
jgi:Fe-S-cluster containining protein